MPSLQLIFLVHKYGTLRILAYVQMLLWGLERNRNCFFLPVIDWWEIPNMTLRIPMFVTDFSEVARDVLGKRPRIASTNTSPLLEYAHATNYDLQLYVICLK